MILKTERLILRPWCEEDFEPFAKLKADPRVMEHFPTLLSIEESTALAKKFQKNIDERGWGFWAVSLIESKEFIGAIGLNAIDSSFPDHLALKTEVGWKLAYDYWGKGYATEGAKACLQFGFETLNLDEIVAFTVAQNVRSRAVMEKLGMHRDQKGDFDHPKLEEGHKLRRHVLYTIQQTEFLG